MDFFTVAMDNFIKKFSLLLFQPDFFYDYNGTYRFSTVTVEIAFNLAHPPKE